MRPYKVRQRTAVPAGPGPTGSGGWRNLRAKRDSGQGVAAGAAAQVIPRRLTLHAGKAYDVPRCREALRRRQIKARIARRGVESSERLGRHRWVVERTLAWFGRFRRLTVRYERRADIHQAFQSLAAALICWRYVRRLS